MNVDHHFKILNWITFWMPLLWS